MSLAAHSLLNSLNGSVSHNFGTALLRAKSAIPKDLHLALRRLQKLANGLLNGYKALTRMKAPELAAAKVVTYKPQNLRCPQIGRWEGEG